MSDMKTTVASYATAGSAVIFGLTANEIAALSGAFCAIATFVLNWYYKHRQFKLIEARSIAAEVAAGCGE